MQAGVVRPSDSPWRSNVVLVKKPTSANESRDNTKASYQTGEQNMSKLYRICLDFRELNEVLEFPNRQTTPYPTKNGYKGEGIDIQFEPDKNRVSTPYPELNNSNLSYLSD